MNNDHWLFFPLLGHFFLVSPPFGSPSARPGFLWGQGRLEFPHSCSRRAGYVGERFWVFHLVFLQRLLNLVSFLQNWSFWTLFPFLHFGRQDGFFSVYLEERVFSFWVFSKYPFHGRRELLLRKEEGMVVFTLTSNSNAPSWFPRCQFDIFEHKALSIMLWQSWSF